VVWGGGSCRKTQLKGRDWSTTIFRGLTFSSEKSILFKLNTYSHSLTIDAGGEDFSRVTGKERLVVE